ncbi:transporter, CPA2 family [Dethiosulfatibacter aminovorans DSM 17477]|uniref:Transporter, CPA2 family n=1 Tax=Dethiosulfatibacter aminovorans DSM 17477 TaxID=1121476 RepID=A0A1M6CEX1_9FIRM|nr:cation:proton antiporter [Dethiosulfatibacter aminovorans]SHI59248.1 transporter, CPA2 family [Dethiosulfatibacter aminovorans DSM 17477]
MNEFTCLGIAVIVGLLAGKAINKLKIPSVAGYIIAGLLLGISGLNITNTELLDKLSFISDFALGIIAFNIGSEFEIPLIKRLGKSIFIIAFFESFIAFALVTGALLLLGQSTANALVLGAVAAATAPAATTMVLKELKAKGSLTSTLLGVVAVDDAICLMIFSVSSAIAKVFIKNEALTVTKVFLHPLMEIVLSLIAGAIIGLCLSYVLNKERRSVDVLSYILGAILLLIGITTAFHLSALLSAMAMGVMVANLVPDNRYAFEQIETFSTPIVSIFFILAGSRLNISMIPQLGLVGVVYFAVRIIGKTAGASLGAVIAKSSKTVRKYIGMGLYSQVGVAVGLAISVSREFAGTDLGDIVITILLATTILTEVIGPVATKTAIINAGESQLHKPKVAPESSDNKKNASSKNIKTGSNSFDKWKENNEAKKKNAAN